MSYQEFIFARSVVFRHNQTVVAYIGHIFLMDPEGT